MATSSTDPDTLSPLPVRLAAWVVLVAVAVAAIWLVDRRAMLRMMDAEAHPTAPPAQTAIQ